MEIAQDSLTRWAEYCDQGVNANKTMLMLFQKGYKLPIFRRPCMKGEILQLGIVLDNKLTWKQNRMVRLTF